MAGDSLANTLNFLQQELGTQQRPIPAASAEFLSSVNNPNVRNFGPGQQPQFQSPALAAIFGRNNKNETQKNLANSLAIQAAAPQVDGNGNPESTPQGNQGFLAQIMRSLGLSNVADPLLGRNAEIDDILNQANQ